MTGWKPKKRCAELVDKSFAMVTALVPAIGYDAAASIAKEAFATGRTVREVCRERKLLSEEELLHVLDPWRMTEVAEKTIEDLSPRSRDYALLYRRAINDTEASSLMS